MSQGKIEAQENQNDAKGKTTKSKGGEADSCWGTVLETPARLLPGALWSSLAGIPPRIIIF